MSTLHRNRNIPADPAAATPQRDLARPLEMSPPGRVPRTRTGAAWLAFNSVSESGPYTQHGAAQPVAGFHRRRVGRN